MAKRYLGGGVSFEQKDVYQEFSEDGGGGGSTTLAGLTDVDISEPTNGQTLVYNAESGKWENGTGGDAALMTLGTISADSVTMTYDEVMNQWNGVIFSDISVPESTLFAGRNMSLKINGELCSLALLNQETGTYVDEAETTDVYLGYDSRNDPIFFAFSHYGNDEPVITDVSIEVFAPTTELALFLGGNPK